MPVGGLEDGRITEGECTEIDEDKIQVEMSVTEERIDSSLTS
jgi:hypothetical protein